MHWGIRFVWDLSILRSILRNPTLPKNEFASEQILNFHHLQLVILGEKSLTTPVVLDPLCKQMSWAGRTASAAKSNTLQVHQEIVILAMDKIDKIQTQIKGLADLHYQWSVVVQFLMIL